MSHSMDLHKDRILPSLRPHCLFGFSLMPRNFTKPINAGFYPWDTMKKEYELAYRWKVERMKIRFIEPGNLPYRVNPKNLIVYDKYIRNPSQGAMILATIVNQEYQDVLIYSESISKIRWDDVLDADIIFITIFTFNADRGYKLADYIRKNSKATIVFGGLHATLNPEEAMRHADLVMIGEGDETILKVVHAIDGKGSFDFAGVRGNFHGEEIDTGQAVPPTNLDVVPNRNLVYRFKKMASHNTLWPQVHASRGCPHHCDYCSLVAAFGSGVRVRTPQNVIDDIRAAIAFFDEGHHRKAKMLWITDDNFFANRAWAKSVLELIISEGIRYNFTIQARYDVGFDDEMLDLLVKAGFSELAVGIEFLEDEAFNNYHKKSSYAGILEAVHNIQRHGLRVRGLFIVGADNHTKGVGKRIADFILTENIQGCLVQSMYFVPGTPVYETHKDKLFDSDWSRCTGMVVHYPEHLSPSELQEEIIDASKTVYSFGNLLRALVKKRGIERLLYAGEYFWQREVRRDLSHDLPYLRRIEQQSQ